MAMFQLFNWLATAAALALFAWSVLQVLTQSRQAMRRGESRVNILTQITTWLIGMALIVSSALAVGTGLGFLLLRISPSLNPYLVLTVQMAGAYATAWIASWIYQRWLGKRVRSWFMAEKGTRHHG